MRLLAPLAALALVACQTVPTPRDTLDSIARDYVRLSLTIGEKEDGYIDAYYGPKDWAEQAKRTPRPLPELRTAVETRLQQLSKVDETGLAPLEIRRKRLLAAQLTAARTRMAMMAGESLDFENEAEGLYALRPALKPLTDYDPVLQRLEAVFPGDGPLWQRVDAFASTTAIPADKLQAVMHASIDECKRRTLEHIALPTKRSSRWNWSPAIRGPATTGTRAMRPA